MDINYKLISKLRNRGYTGIKNATRKYIRSWIEFYELDEESVDLDAICEEFAYRYKNWITEWATSQLKK